MLLQLGGFRRGGVGKSGLAELSVGIGTLGVIEIFWFVVSDGDVEVIEGLVKFAGGVVNVCALIVSVGEIFRLGRVEADVRRKIGDRTGVILLVPIDLPTAVICFVLVRVELYGLCNIGKGAAIVIRLVAYPGPLAIAVGHIDLIGVRKAEIFVEIEDRKRPLLLVL